MKAICLWKKLSLKSQTWWYTPVIPAGGSEVQGFPSLHREKFKASPSHPVYVHNDKLLAFPQWLGPLSTLDGKLGPTMCLICNGSLKCRSRSTCNLLKGKFEHMASSVCRSCSSGPHRLLSRMPCAPVVFLSGHAMSVNSTLTYLCFKALFKCSVLPESDAHLSAPMLLTKESKCLSSQRSPAAYLSALHSVHSPLP